MQYADLSRTKPRPIASDEHGLYLGQVQAFHADQDGDIREVVIVQDAIGPNGELVEAVEALDNLGPDELAVLFWRNGIFKSDADSVLEVLSANGIVLRKVRR